MLIWSAHSPQATVILTYERKACVNVVSTQPTSDSKTLLREEDMCYNDPQARTRLTYGRKACVNIVSTQRTSDSKTLLREEGMC